MSGTTFLISIIFFTIVLDVFSDPITILTKATFETSYWEHGAVMQSIHNGLKKLHADYNYNPNNPEDIHKTVWVVAGSTAFEEAVKLKKSGKIKNLFAGPTVLITDIVREIEATDAYLVPTPIVKKFLLDNIDSRLESKILFFFSGVDTDFWEPAKNKKNCDVLVYKKTCPDDLFQEVIKLLTEHDYRPVVIEYGKYQLKHYKKVLNEVMFAIFLSESESQGIALLESWSMDVPTLVWKTKNKVQVRIIPNVIHESDELSPAPFLTSETGFFWSDTEYLKELLNNKDEIFQKTSPRKWVLNHMTDELAAENFISTFREFDKKKNH